ncbi:hypothetical protein V6Z11_D06G215200 [Gossypium hirsutum]
MIRSCKYQIRAPVVAWRSFKTLSATEKWDGLFSIKTTSISDNKIYHYHLNLRGSVSARRLTRIPSIPKNDAKFRFQMLEAFTE